MVVLLGIIAVVPTCDVAVVIIVDAPSVDDATTGVAVVVEAVKVLLFDKRAAVAGSINAV